MPAPRIPGLAAHRTARGLTQAELARRAGLPRSSVGAIEAGRLRPSVDAALAVAGALGCSVEALFGAVVAAAPPADPWAFEPPAPACRYWIATVGERRLRYPVETAPGLAVPHDGTWRADHADVAPTTCPPAQVRTLVLAGCDPAAGLLAAAYQAATGDRLLAFPRSGGAALELLGRGVVHAAALHRSTVEAPRRNAETVRQRLGPGYRLLRVAEWQAGIAIARGAGAAAHRDDFAGVRRWAAREVGSAARECLEELLGRPLPRQRAWSGHAAVAMAVRDGFADAGVCVRLCAEEAGLDFVPVRTESLDLCFPAALERDPALQALIRLLRSRAVRGVLAELPGYDATHTGTLDTP